MDPYHEQRLRDEVIYLHSLWHQGPPSTTPTSRPERKLPQQPPNPTNKLLKPNPPSNSDIQWPQPNIVSGSSTRLETAEEKARNLVLKLQHNASNAFKEFLAKSGCDSDDDSEEEDDYWVGNGDDKYLLFLRIFLEDYGLRKYYQENSEGGEFCCLVCYGLGRKNSGRRFKSCLGVAQHSIAISKTKSKSNDSHRALAQAICRVLGWDFDKLPVVVLKGQPLGPVLIKKGETQGNVGNEGTHKDLGNTDKGVLGELVSNQTVVSTSEWPCEKPVDNSSSTALEWRAFEPSLASAQLASAANSVSAEDQARLTVMRSQHVAVKACQNYFQRKKGLDCSEHGDESGDEDTNKDSNNEEEDVYENSEDEEEGNSNEEEDASKDSKLFNFFFNLFKEENGKLRDFYVNNWEAGEFCCLVCGGIGKKVWKRYKGCVALVQHSTAISKTKKKLAHRAYGQVVCQVLGWDINRLPSIVLKGEAFGLPSQNSCDKQGELKEDSDHHNEGIVLDRFQCSSERNISERPPAHKFNRQ
ncbi:uncharacterized protein LOC133802508 isoform X2 [Humulus lupulus]|uniref:uncharacterized protein LOC133802508 isoform X2 n=1 Tax=Humulus lupulus TaxID=3486 RepID=UPI002B415457|nr:uncharacterized protein LOC133802508 isoform X2 [Humulus lupulus]